MSRLVVYVEFRVKPEDHAAFARLLAANAAASLETEPGCARFDVLTPEGAKDGRFVLYEIYADDAAFDAHLRTEHFLAFDRATAGTVLERRIARLRFSEPG